MHERMKTLLAGAMNELVVDNPENYRTDVSPVVDQETEENLQKVDARLITKTGRSALAQRAIYQQSGAKKPDV